MQALDGQSSRAKQKTGHLHLGWEDVIQKDLKEMGTSLGGYKKGGFEQIGMEEECAQLCWPQVAWCCGEFLVVVGVVAEVVVAGTQLFVSDKLYI